MQKLKWDRYIIKSKFKIQISYLSSLWQQSVFGHLVYYYRYTCTCNERKKTLAYQKPMICKFHHFWVFWSLFDSSFNKLERKKITINVLKLFSLQFLQAPKILWLGWGGVGGNSMVIQFSILKSNKKYLPI